MEYKNIKYKYNKFNIKLKSNGKVVEKKVLNKYLDEDGINIDVFVVTEEIISKSVLGDINN